MDPLQIQIFASGLSFFSSLLVTIFLLVNNPRDHVARSFIIMSAMLSAWSIFGLLAHISKDINLVESFRIISVIFIALLSGAVANFAITFYEESRKTTKTPYSTHRKIFYSISAILAITSLSDLFGFSKLIVAGMMPDQTYVFSPIPGTFMPVLVTFFFLSVLYTGFLVFMARKGASIIIQKQSKWITLSIVIGFIAGGTRFATWYDIPISPAIASLAAPIFIVGIFYAITKHKLFNTKIITAELLTFSIWIFLVFRVLLAKTPAEQLTELILLFIVIIFGIFLIKNVSKEVYQREQLEKITAKLRNLNETLEQKVEERTKEINRAKIHTDTIIKNLTLGLIEYDKDFKILRINAAAEKLLGIKENDVKNKQILPKDKNKKKLSSLASVLYSTNTKKTNELFAENTELHEISIFYPDKKDLQIITTKIIYPKGIGFIKLIRDISYENTVKKAKSDFISIAAHQLKTPLSGIKWMFRLILSGDFKKLSAKAQKELLEKGNTANEHLIQIVNDFLDVIQMEEGYYEYRFKKNNIIDILEKLLDIAKFTAKDKKLTFKFTKPDKIIPNFAFDAQKIKTVIQNILDNAVTYTPSGGKITINLLQKNNYVTVEISDTGIGIPKNEMKHIFTKFFRSKKALHTETDRSGLGLFIVKNIIDAHNGKIKITSEENKGTSVIFSLPLDIKES